MDLEPGGQGGFGPGKSKTQRNQHGTRARSQLGGFFQHDGMEPCQETDASTVGRLAMPLFVVGDSTSLRGPSVSLPLRPTAPVCQRGERDEPVFGAAS